MGFIIFSALNDKNNIIYNPSTHPSFPPTVFDRIESSVTSSIGSCRKQLPYTFQLDFQTRPTETMNVIQPSHSWPIPSRLLLFGSAWKICLVILSWNILITCSFYRSCDLLMCRRDSTWRDSLVSELRSLSCNVTLGICQTFFRSSNWTSVYLTKIIQQIFRLVRK